MLRWGCSYNTAIRCLPVWFQFCTASIKIFHLAVNELKVFDSTSWCDIPIPVKVNVIMIDFYLENVRSLVSCNHVFKDTVEFFDQGENSPTH